MAEIEAIFEAAEEATEVMETEAEGYSEAEKIEIQAETAAARTEINKFSELMSQVSDFLKQFNYKSAALSVSCFIAKNLAIGAILWGVNVTLNKMFAHTSGKSSETKKRMRNVIKALSDLISSEAELNQETLKWMKEHQDDVICLEGLEIQMEDILKTHLKPIAEASEKAEKIAESLQETVDGQLQFKVPEVYTIKRFIDITGVFIQAFSDLINFIKQKEDRVKELKSFPLTQEDVDDLRMKLSKVMALPMWDE
ncbi:hypothetical protein Baya_16689 [Bagarius yarrelli]|uniref:Uncharacterized protein n=1 Tax=Bagarius yarrelli TaxID=175774 RepID=A0A556VXN8_BAGYA|nr:hypothetical protein Baya_16689 [Bagarius yarrelli]